MAFEYINIRQIIPTSLSRDAIIVDIRTPERFRKGHIPLAVNLPMELIKNRQVSLPKARTLIVYCDTGGASTQASHLLSDMGYSVINCVGGLRNYTGSTTSLS